jgi:DNA-binding MarR family transcriptional regulator
VTDKNTNRKTAAKTDNDKGVGDIDKIAGFHIRLAHGEVRRHFMETFSHLGLTQKQVSVLWLVSDHPGIAQTDLCQRLRMDRATVMAIVNRLQGRRLLNRGASKVDKRKQTLALSAKGEALLKDAKDAIHEHEKWLKSRFTKAEVNSLIDMLQRIHG